MRWLILIVLGCSMMSFGQSISGIDIQDRGTEWCITINESGGNQYVYFHKKPVDKAGNVIDSEVDSIIQKVKVQYRKDKNAK